jgi:hypothetical protein
MTRISTFHPSSVAASEPSSQSLVLEADCGAENSSFNILSKYSLPPSCWGSSSSSSFPGGTASLGSCPVVPTQLSSETPSIAPLSRRDAPVIRHTKRGRIDLALDATLSGETKLQALKTLEQDEYAKNSKVARESIWNSYQLLHVSWFGKQVPVLPMTATKINAIGAMLKQGMYRSPQVYFDKARDTHIDDGYEWTPGLSRRIRKVIRSVTRGMGPSRQTFDIDLQDVASQRFPDTPLCTGGPIGPKNCYIAGSFFMTREVELSLAVWEHIDIDWKSMKVTWNLPASKTDPMALGKRRTWGCVCEGDLSKPCGFHALTLQEDLCNLLFANESKNDGDLPQDLPVFPTREGKFVSKIAMVSTFTEIAKSIGISTECAGGHVCRISGARHLARINVDIWLIQLMARWQSPVVLRYIQDAPLHMVTDLYKRNMAQSTLDKTLECLSSQVAALSGKLASMKSDTLVALRETMECRQMQVALPPLVDPDAAAVSSCRVLAPSRMMEAHFVRNDASGIVHRPLTFSHEVAREAWRTACGWAFAGASFSTRESLTTHHRQICGSCLPEEKAAAKAASHAASTDVTSSALGGSGSESTSSSSS